MKQAGNSTSSPPLNTSVDSQSGEQRRASTTLLRWVRTPLIEQAAEQYPAHGEQAPLPGGIDEELTRTARLLNTLLLILLGITAANLLILPFQTNALRIVTVIAALLLVELFSYFLLHAGRVRESAIVLVSIVWVVLAAAAAVSDGIATTAYTAMFLVVATAGLLLGGRSGFLVAGLSSIYGLLLLFVRTSEASPLSLPVLLSFRPLSFWISTSLFMFALAGLVYLVTSSLRDAMQRSRENEQHLAASNEELRLARMDLEAEVARRTQALQQRSGYLQASIEVARATASLLDTARLLETAVELIRQQFGLYYVGIFTVDSSGEWAVLQAATGKAGQALLARRHRIRIGTGMIGWSISNALPRIAQQTSEDAVRLAIPELPETRSEAAIPLQSRGKILGAISLQSRDAGAFSEIEITIFQALADQVATALENAQLFIESQRSLQEAQRAYGASSQQAWQDLLQRKRIRAYQYDQSGIHEVAESGAGFIEQSPQEQRTPGRSVAVQESAANGRAESHSGDVVQLPVRIRDQQVGMITFHKEGGQAGNSDSVKAESLPGSETAESGTGLEQTWSAEELELLRNLVDQMGIALDSARLYEDAQRLAYRQQLASQVTGKIRSTLDLETVLQTAVQEIQQSLNLSEVVISLGESVAPQAGTPSVDTSPAPPVLSTSFEGESEIDSAWEGAAHGS
jgi:GAF domain-containing protein